MPRNAPSIDPRRGLNATPGLMSTENAAAQCPAIHAPILPLTPWRWALAAFGVFFVAVAAVGVVVPGLPTTIFLIIASWLFAKSCPWLENKLIRNRFFRPFLVYLEPGARMPLRAKVIAITLMWLAISASTGAFMSHGQWLIALPVVLAGCVGTWFISRR